MNSVAIVADIGGTNARFALRTMANAELSQLHIYPCAEYESLAQAVEAYIAEFCADKTVAAICIAIAGPVLQDWIHLPNSHWSFSQQALRDSLGIPLQVINDFTAQALALPSYQHSDLILMGNVTPLGGNHFKAVLGPGTGLGVAALTPGGEVIPSEGGHTSFAPTNQHELELLQVLWRKHSRVSAERMLSGMGLENLYWANSVLQGKEQRVTAPEIGAQAEQGNAIAQQAIADFYNILAATAGDLALMFGATGGVYISGGVVPKTLKFIDHQAVRARFEAKGRFSDLLKTIALAVVVAEQPGLMGCAQAVGKDINH